MLPDTTHSGVVPEMCVDRNLRYFPTTALCPAERDSLLNPQDVAGYTLPGEEYSSVHLLASLFGPNPGRRVMGMFETYFDASGAEREIADSPQSGPILVVAGYLAHVDEWRSLEKDWKLLLDRKGLAYFDMAQFASLKGPYAAWAEKEREEFIQSLLLIIKRRAGVLITWGIEVDDWLNDRQLVKAYTLCALACIATVSDWAKLCGYDEKILHVFESGYEGALPDLRTAFRLEDLDAYSIKQPITQPKRDLAPLQAAAILAHQTGCARDKRRMGDDLAPYLNELHQTRGLSSMLSRELLTWPEDVIRIAELRKSPLWPFPNLPRENTVTFCGLGDMRHTIRLKLLELMFAPREPKGIETPRG